MINHSASYYTYINCEKKYSQHFTASNKLMTRQKWIRSAALENWQIVRPAGKILQGNGEWKNLTN